MHVYMGYTHCALAEPDECHWQLRTHSSLQMPLHTLQNTEPHILTNAYNTSLLTHFSLGSWTVNFPLASETSQWELDSEAVGPAGPCSLAPCTTLDTDT
jgi:hypothetical protein